MDQTAEQLRDAAIEAVKLPAGNLYEECLAWAHRWVVALMPGEKFTSGDVASNYPGRPAEPRVWGAVLRQLHKDRICFPTGTYDRHPSRSRHCAPALVWARALPITHKEEGRK